MSVNLKKSSISYTQRDFDSIKEGLVDFARRYYPNIVNDFNEASFNSFVLDIVAYVGDVMSFYVDYQANESFLISATEATNIFKHAKSVNYPLRGRAASYGQLAVFVQVPADAAGGVDTNFLPILKKGTLFSSTGGGTFSLIEDIDYRKNNITALVSKVDGTTGTPTKFALKGYGQIMSGAKRRKDFILTELVKFRRLEVPEGNLVTEIESVVDSHGNEYYQVENLSQNLVYAQIPNGGTDKTTVRYKLQRLAAPRRYVVEYDNGRSYIRFGAGSETKISDDIVNEPRNVVLQQSGRDYISSVTFDPTKLVDTDKFGIAPSNTTITVDYRVNTAATVNAAANTIRGTTLVKMVFPDRPSGSPATQSEVVQSVESVNEFPVVGDVSPPTTTELKTRILGHYSAQNRAVTKEDYISVVYKMDPRFGSVTRCNVAKDMDSNRRNVNIYTAAEDKDGYLIAPTATLKRNLKNWLIQYKPINDEVDILDGIIVNFGINYSIIIDDNFNKYDVLSAANRVLGRKFSRKRQFGQNLFISDVFRDLVVNVDGLLDVVDMELINKTGGLYSEVSFDINTHLSGDGRYLVVPEDTILELKFPEVDIKGMVI